MGNENIMKVWGFRRRLLLTPYSEIDLLHIKKDTFCSTHNHLEKANKFCVISGKVEIQTELGSVILKDNENWTCYAPQKHRFRALEDSVMVEIAFTQPPHQIDENDINREKQGGKIINGEELSIPELEAEGLLEL